MKAGRKLLLAGAALVSVLGLAACGGGGGGGFSGFPVTTTQPATTTPPAASDPYDVFLAYLKDLVNQVLDSSEPAGVAQFDPPPTSETKEPVALQ